jgi:hypothetical protein
VRRIDCRSHTFKSFGDVPCVDCGTLRSQMTDWEVYRCVTLVSREDVEKIKADMKRGIEP